MSVVSLASGRPIDAEALGKRRAAAQAELARNTARLDEERRAWRERKRAWRYLRRGGVALREDLGGAIGVRWLPASRHGPALDTPICERWLERGRLLLREVGPGYRWSTAACEPPPPGFLSWGCSHDFRPQRGRCRVSLFAASTAVMATRAPDLVEADDAERALWRKLDFYPTPPWAARAGLELIRSLDPGATDLWEPACGQGHIAQPLRELGCRVQATDIHPFGYGAVHDFLAHTSLPDLARGRWPEWVITNPPFRHAAAFIQRGLEVASQGVAILARLSFMEAACRYELLFNGVTPVSVVAPFIERVPMQLGAYVPGGDTATAYAWFVWIKKARSGAAPELRPIPPGTRARLTRPDDARRWGRLADAPLLDEAADG